MLWSLCIFVSILPYNGAIKAAGLPPLLCPSLTADASLALWAYKQQQHHQSDLRTGLFMARSANRNGKDRDSRVAAPPERGEMRELSLEEVLKCYEQPINEEQAWAVCYQCCRELKPPRPNTAVHFLIPELSAIILHRDGTVTAHLKRTGET